MYCSMGFSFHPFNKFESVGDFFVFIRISEEEIQKKRKASTEEERCEDTHHACSAEEEGVPCRHPNSETGTVCPLKMMLIKTPLSYR